MLAYCESFPKLAWFPKFPTPVVVASALFALSPCLPPSLALSLSLFLSRCLPHPPPFSPSPSPCTSSLLLLSRRIVGLWERKDIASIGVLVRVCGRWRLLWQGESEIRGCLVGNGVWVEYNLFPRNGVILSHVLSAAYCSVTQSLEVFFFVLSR